MKHSQLTRLILVAWLLLMSGMSNVGCQKGDVNFGSHDSKALSAAVVLHRTSAKDVILTNRDGLGIVPGYVRQISMSGPIPNSIIVEFAPFDGSSSRPENKFMLVELSTGSVRLITDEQAKKGTRFIAVGEVIPP